jgi:hypothetical protein
MNHLYTLVYVGEGNSVRVTLDAAANVLILTQQDYQRYLSGRSYSYYGGHFTESPAVVRPPMGQWVVVVDLGGYPGRVAATVSIF